MSAEIREGTDVIIQQLTAYVLEKAGKRIIQSILKSFSMAGLIF